MNQRNIKYIDVILHKGVGYFHPSNLTEIGLFLVSPPYVKVDWDKMDSQEKFSQLTEAFYQYRSNIPAPSDIDSYLQVRMDAFEIENWVQFSNESFMCHILLDLDNREYKITPSIYLGNSDSHYGVKHGVRKVSTDATPEEFIVVVETVLKSIPLLTQEYIEGRLQKSK
jgi:hypothetical protein